MNEPRFPDHIEASQIFGLTVEHSRNAMLLIGPGRRPLYANRAFLDMSGYEYDEWIEIARTSVLTPERDQLKTGNSLNRAIQGETTEFRLRPILRKDGSEIWVEACINALQIAGEAYLCAEFRPPYAEPPDGGVGWQPTQR